MSTSPDIPLKRCTRCQQEFPATLEYFHAQKLGVAGLASRCKVCIQVLKIERRTNPPIPIPARKKAVPGTHTAAQIAEQLKRQHYRCYYAACGFAKFPRINGQYVYEVEHTFPLSRVVGMGIPANDMGYLVLSCQKCNDDKGTRYPWEWPEGGRLL